MVCYLCVLNCISCIEYICKKLLEEHKEGSVSNKFQQLEAIASQFKCLKESLHYPPHSRLSGSIRNPSYTDGLGYTYCQLAKETPLAWLQRELATWYWCALPSSEQSHVVLDVQAFSLSTDLQRLHNCLLCMLFIRYQGVVYLTDPTPDKKSMTISVDNGRTRMPLGKFAKVWRTDLHEFILAECRECIKTCAPVAFYSTISRAYSCWLCGTDTWLWHEC